jgi:phosphoribosylformimino-5-aminoimidazole carboxamide ribotide isomerase
MIVYPATDLRGGKVVRLRKGDPDRQTVFSENPLATVQSWIEQGATWIHMVNLDGAFATTNDNGRILEQASKLNARIQFGGGLRQMRDIARALERGASRVVLGTLAVQQPDVVGQAIERWGAEAICIALDALDGRIATHGWQETIELTPTELGKQMVQLGAKYALYTDVSRDGGLQGVNIEATAKLAHETGLHVIASGGVSSVDDIRRLAQSKVATGVVIGMALYEGRLTLQDALKAAGGQDAG